MSIRNLLERLFPPRRTDLYEFMRVELKARALALGEAYRSAQPFPHVMIDDFLPRDVAEEILRRFPGEDFPGYRRPDYLSHQVLKLGRLQDSGFAGVDPWLRDAIFQFNSPAFLDFLEALTGITGLIGDAHFQGGACHMILPGGKLDVHADFNIDERRRLRRRINVLIYFNKDWKDEYGGHLELWNRDMTVCERTFAPVFNRCVIFNTSSTSFHGHPRPLACPRGMARKSLAFYYYTSDPAAFDPAAAHTTLWQETPARESREE